MNDYTELLRQLKIGQDVILMWGVGMKVRIEFTQERRNVGGEHNRAGEERCERRAPGMIPQISREPDLIAEGYLERWCLTDRSDGGSIYLDHFLGPDLAVFHDHPWSFTTTIMHGAYTERSLVFGKQGVEVCSVRHNEGSHIAHKDPRAMHYIEKLHGDVWTLVVTGRRVREWGFLNEFGEWEQHTDYENRTGLRQKVTYGPGYAEEA